MGNCLPALSKWRPSFRRKAASSTPPTGQTARGRQARSAAAASAAPPAGEPKKLTRAEKRIAMEIAAHAARHASAQYPPAFDMPPPAAGRRPAGADFESLNFAASFEAADATRRVGQPPALKQEEEAKASTARSDPRRSFRRPRKAYLASSALPPIPNADSPFDPLDTAPHQANHNLSISVQPDLFASLGAAAQTGAGGAGADAVSVSRNVSKNGVSFFPHFSFNDEGKEREEEEGDEVSAGGRTGGEEGEEEKSRLSSTEMDEDISMRYMTPTIASNHIVRPLPSPSSLSVPQPSIGSGINSSEHSIVQSTMTAPVATYRATSLPSTSASSASSSFFFSPKTGQEMYSDPENSTSPPSAAAPHAAAASPPSTTSPLAHAASATFARQQYEPQPPPASVTASHARGPAHAAYYPTANLQSPPAPAADHLTLNTNAVALASALFDDGGFGSRSAGAAGEWFSGSNMQQQQQQQQRQQQLPQRASVGSIPQQRASAGPSFRPSGLYSAANSSAAASQLADLSSAPSIHRHSSQPVELTASAASSATTTSPPPPASSTHLGFVDELVSADVSSASPGASGRVIARPALHAQSRSISSLGAGGKAADRGSRSPVAGSRSHAGRRGKEAAVKAAAGSAAGGGAVNGAISDEDVGDSSRPDGEGEDGNATVLDSGGRRVR